MPSQTESFVERMERRMDEIDLRPRCSFCHQPKELEQLMVVAGKAYCLHCAMECFD